MSRDCACARRPSVRQADIVGADIIGADIVGGCHCQRAVAGTFSLTAVAFGKEANLPAHKFHERVHERPTPLIPPPLSQHGP